MEVYIATAYRYGWLNGSTHHVAAGIDQQAVIDATYREAYTCGGKYGYAVVRESDGKRIHYLPSSYGESGPSVNPRIALSERLGSDVLSRIEGGDKDVPAWLRELVDHHRACLEAIGVK